VKLLSIVATCALVIVGCAGPEAAPDGEGGTSATDTQVPLTTIRLERQESGTDVLLQAVSAVDSNVVWVSGHGGTWVRTLDGGRTWSAHVMPGADTLQFRDVHALDADRAWLLSAGPGEMSRI
jgi:hypothetical protein